MKFSRLSILVLLASAAPLAAQTTNLAAPPAGLPDTAAAAFRMIGSLIFVFALFFGGVWLFRNWQRLAQIKGRAQKLQIIEARSLGNRSAVFVVGYEQQRMLVASSSSGVSLLSHLPPADAASEPPSQPQGPAASFAAALQQVFNRKP